MAKGISLDNVELHKKTRNLTENVESLAAEHDFKHGLDGNDDNNENPDQSSHFKYLEWSQEPAKYCVQPNILQIHSIELAQSY